MQRPSGSCTSLTCSSNERTRGCSMHTLISSATFLSRSQASSSGRISWTASAPARTRPMTLSILLVAMRGRWRRLRRGSPPGSSHAFLTVGGVLLARPAIGTSSSAWPVCAELCGAKKQNKCQRNGTGRTNPKHLEQRTGAWSHQCPQSFLLWIPGTLMV